MLRQMKFNRMEVTLTFYDGNERFQCEECGCDSFFRSGIGSTVGCASCDAIYKTILIEEE
jgi:hypothetical protein